MKKIAIITILILAFYFIQYYFSNLIGRWVVPNFLILLIIYFNYCFGIRYSLYSAIFGGLLLDSYSIVPFGLQTFSFLCCAYLSSILFKYLHLRGSRSARMMIVFLVCLANFIIQYFLHLIVQEVNLLDALQFVLFPELIATLVLAPITFQILKQCVSKFFVSL